MPSGVRRAFILLLTAALGAGCATRPPRPQTPSPAARIVPGVPVREFPDDHCGPGSLSVVLNTLGDPVTMDELRAILPRAPGGGVLSVDLLLAARERGFEAALLSGTEEMIRREIDGGRPAILMMRLLNAPGRDRDVYHYVVVDGLDPVRGLLRFQFGDGETRWSALDSLEGAWEGAGHALLTIRPLDAPSALEEAVALEREGRLVEAAARYEEIVEGDPDSVRGWVNLGNVRMRQGQSAAATRAYRKALAVDPHDPDALNNLAWLLLQEGSDLEEAETLARSALPESGRHRALVLDTLARIQGARGRCADAVHTLEAALALPDLADGRRLDLERARSQVEETCRPDAVRPSGSPSP